MTTYATKDSSTTNGMLGVIIGLAIAAIIGVGIYMYYNSTAATTVTPPVTERNVQIDVTPANEPVEPAAAPMTTNPGVSETNTANPPGGIDTAPVQQSTDTTQPSGAAAQ